MRDNPKKLARQTGLRYLTDKTPGIRRKKVGRGFSYFAPNGDRIRDQAERERLKQLAIPPSWQEVWICPLEEGHLQATGRDRKGRKQYRYHPKWREMRDRVKFNRMIAFGKALNNVRQQTNRHLQLEGLPRQKVLALVIRLLETTLIRVGNTTYAKTNKSYGLTTLRTRHVTIDGHEVEFEFTGKSGVHHHIELADKRLTNIIKKCYEIPGYTLFQYLDNDGKRQDINSEDVNEYLKEVTGEDFTAKEFRTWAGTVLTAQVLSDTPDKPCKTHVPAAVKVVAKQLGNRPATCRKYYIHPRIPEAYLSGELIPAIKSARRKVKNLEPYECAVLSILDS